MTPAALADACESAASEWEFPPGVAEHPTHRALMEAATALRRADANLAEAQRLTAYWRERWHADNERGEALAGAVEHAIRGGCPHDEPCAASAWLARDRWCTACDLVAALAAYRSGR